MKTNSHQLPFTGFQLSPIKIHQSVLLVDSNAIIANNISKLIVQLNHSCLGFVGNLEDMEKAIAQKEPDMIMINIATEGRFDGYQLAKFLKLDHEIPFYVICNEKNSNERKWAEELNPDGFVMYSSNDQILLNQLKFALD